MKKILQTILFSTILINGFSQTNTLSWAKAMGGTSFNSASSLKVDASGNVFTVGYFNGTTDFDPGTGTFNLISAGFSDVFISKLDAAGNFLWAKQLGGANYDYANSVAIDASGNVYTTGYFQGTGDFDPGTGVVNLTSNGSADIFITKLDAGGNFLWAKSIGGTNYDNANSIAVDAAGNVYTVGDFNGTVDFDPGTGTFNLSGIANGDVFILKLNATGNFVYAKNLKSDNLCYGYSIALDASTNIYTCGSFEGTIDLDPGATSFTLNAPTGGGDIYVSKLDANGNFIWGKGMGGLDYEEAKAIAVDAFGNVYTTGYFQNVSDFDPGVGTFTLDATGNFDEVFISKLDASGNFVWAKQLSGGGNDNSHSITTDALNNVYTTGFFTQTVDFDPGAGTFTLNAGTNPDVFISKLDLNGNFVFAEKTGSGQTDEGRSIQLDPIGNVYTAGSFRGTVDFDPGVGTFTLNSGANDGAFVHKICMVPPTPINVTPSPNQVICTPNNSTTLTVSGTGTINWYTSPTSTLSLSTGTAFITPTLSMGTYTYYAEAGTCTTSISRTPVTVTVSGCIGITELNTSEQLHLNIYPNPTEGTFEIALEGKADLIVTNAVGQIVQQQSLSEGKNSIDMSAYPDGVYFINATIKTTKYHCKLIKQ